MSVISGLLDKLSVIREDVKSVDVRIYNRTKTLQLEREKLETSRKKLETDIKKSAKHTSGTGKHTLRGTLGLQLVLNSRTKWEVNRLYSLAGKYGIPESELLECQKVTEFWSIRKASK